MQCDPIGRLFYRIRRHIYAMKKRHSGHSGDVVLIAMLAGGAAITS